MKHILLILSVLALAGCGSLSTAGGNNAGQAQYTYEFKQPDGSTKTIRLFNTKNYDSLSATFEAPDGTKVTLDEEGINSSDPITSATESMKIQSQTVNKLIERLPVVP